MKRFSLITASLSLALLTGLLCACHKPAETSVSTEYTTVQTTTTESTTYSAVTETTPAATPSDSAPDNSGTPAETTAEIIATQTETYVEYRHVAKGKFNYVLKNKSWKFDGEMYYHKYKDGTIVYYDKETKVWLVMDNSGQGWYYDPEINDFVKDE
ncbi:MAG: hypothetical protein K5869_06705 [Saccharofermentans sp.]|nr:hypothetical protein [Saccharofermentans sp.]